MAEQLDSHPELHEFSYDPEQMESEVELLVDRVLELAGVIFKISKFEGYAVTQKREECGIKVLEICSNSHLIQQVEIQKRSGESPISVSFKYDEKGIYVRQKYKIPSSDGLNSQLVDPAKIGFTYVDDILRGIKDDNQKSVGKLKAFLKGCFVLIEDFLEEIKLVSDVRVEVQAELDRIILAFRVLNNQHLDVEALEAAIDELEGKK